MVMAICLKTLLTKNVLRTTTQCSMTQIGFVVVFIGLIGCLHVARK